MKTKQELIYIYKKARDIILNPKNWCKWSRYNKTIDSEEYCALGALSKAYGNDPSYNCDYEIFKPMMTTLKNKHYREGIGSFNDKHTHKDVIVLFNSTIKRLQKENKRCLVK